MDFSESVVNAQSGKVGPRLIITRIKYVFTTRRLEKVGFTVDVVTQKAYGYRRGENYVYVNREARMGRTALVIHPTLKERSSTLAEPASDIKTCDHYQQFPLYLAGERHEHYGIPHGFSSRVALERYLNGLFGEAS